MGSYSDDMVSPAKDGSSELPQITIEESTSEADPSTGEKLRARCDEIEGIKVMGLTDEELECFYSFTPAMRKKLNRKVNSLS